MNKPFSPRWWILLCLVQVFNHLADGSLVEAGLEFKDYTFGEANPAKDAILSSSSTSLRKNALETVKKLENHRDYRPPVPTKEDIKIFVLSPDSNQEPKNAEHKTLKTRELKTYYNLVSNYLTRLFLLAEAGHQPREIVRLILVSERISMTLEKPHDTAVDIGRWTDDYDMMLYELKSFLQSAPARNPPAGIKYLPLNFAGIQWIFGGCVDIVQGLKDCLQGVKLPEISQGQQTKSVSWDLKQSPEIEIVYIKKTCRAIEYMYTYGLISWEQMIDFFDDEHRIKLIGGHIPFLFNLKNTIKGPFYPDIDFFREDSKTYHLRRCLTSLPEDLRMRFMHSVISQAIRNSPADHKDLEFNRFAEYFTSKTMPNDPETLFHMKMYLKKNSSNWPCYSNKAERLPFKLVFYMLDYILRYGNDKETVFPIELIINPLYKIPVSATRDYFKDEFIAQKLQFKRTQLERSSLFYKNKLAEAGLNDMPFSVAQVEKELKSSKWKLELIGKTQDNLKNTRIRNNNLLQGSIWLPL